MDRALVFAISADYARRTGGWVYDQRLLDGLGTLGWQVRRLELPAGFPDPSPQARTQSAAAFGRLADGTLVLIDQLCLGVLPEVARAQGSRLRLAMIVHHPLAVEGDRPEAARAGLAACEREALSHVALVIVTSPATAAMLQRDYGVPGERVVVAEPGTDRLPLSPGSSAGTLSLLSVGAVVPRKGHDRLIEAMGGLEAHRWRLTIVGNTDRAPDYAAGLRSRLAASGLARRIVLAGELDDAALERCWQEADVFVSASRHEGFGMAVAEAVGRGLPVVATHAGAVGEWLGPDAGLVVPTGDGGKLAAALSRVMSEPELRAELRRGAVAQRERLPTWEATAAQVHRALVRL